MVILSLLILAPFAIAIGWIAGEEFWYLNETKGSYDDCAD